MPEATADRAGYVAALPTFAQSAAMIGIHPSGIGRAVKRLGIEPVRWGNRDKHLSVADLMRLAIDAHRETVQTVASRLLEQVGREHPDQAAAIQADIDAFLAGLAGMRIQVRPTRADQGKPTEAEPSPSYEDVSQTPPPEPLLRGPVEPETARRLVALYTRPTVHEQL
jgi:hypothetical protein